MKKQIIHSLVLCTSIIMITACSDNDKTATGSTPSQNEVSTVPQNGLDTKGSNEATKKYEQGVNLYNQGKVDEAKKLFEESIALDSTNGEFDYYLGNIFRKKNDFEKALEHYQSAFKKSPKLLEAYNNAAAIQMAGQNFDQALEIINKGLSSQPDYSDLKFKKAQILYVKKQFNDSIPLLTDLAKDPANFEAHRFLGLSYIGLNDKTKALEHLKEYLTLAPEGVQFKDKVKQIVVELEKSK